MKHPLARCRRIVGVAASFAAVLVPPQTLAIPQRDSSSLRPAFTDTAITAALRARLQADDRIRPSRIEVLTRDHAVTLTGRVATPAVKAAAESIASRQDGVSSVDNQLVVAREPVPDSTITMRPAELRAIETVNATNTAADALSDRDITRVVISRLRAVKGLEASGITVATTAGVVMLSGRVPRRSALLKAVAIARETRGVNRVDPAKLVIAARR